MKRCCWLIPGAILVALMGCGGSSSNGQHDTGPLSVTLQEVQDQVPGNAIEIQGVSAGAFHPEYWQAGTLNWVPDVRVPLIAPRAMGPYQNIYSPWALEQAGGWRVFYGGWDGTDTPNDRIYSVNTSDFLTFGERSLVIEHGVFENVNNVNVQQLPDGSLHMICTAATAEQFALNKPVYFSSPDGVAWNGSAPPYAAQLTDVISIPNYAQFQAGDFNGANVLLRDGNTWKLYFSNWNDQSPAGTLYLAKSSAPPTFELEGVALGTGHMVNDVRKFQVNGRTWYLMGLHTNIQSVWYTLSNDGVHFGEEHTMFGSAYPLDSYLITLGFVVKNGRVLGVLYGGNIGGAFLAQNEIFGRWLQKKVTFIDSAGANLQLRGAFGPDRQRFAAPSGQPLTMSVYAEDGITLLGSGTVNISSGKAYRVVLQGGG